MRPILNIPFLVFILLIWSSFAGASISCHDRLNASGLSPQKIEEILFNGKVIHYREFSANNNKNPIWKLTLQNSSDQHTVKALFKPRPWGDGDGWNRTTMEYVGYRINQFLGMDYVPPVAYRYNLKFGEKYFSEGSMQVFVEEASSLKGSNPNSWAIKTELFLSDARIFDVLLQNPDRHADNFIIGKHWSKGILMPLLIDQASSLRHGTDTRLGSPLLFLDKPAGVFRRSTYEKLQTLDYKALETLKPFISHDEIMGILSRRDQVVHQIKELIIIKGENQVILSE